MYQKQNRFLLIVTWCVFQLSALCEAGDLTLRAVCKQGECDAGVRLTCIKPPYGGCRMGYCGCIYGEEWSAIEQKCVTKKNIREGSRCDETENSCTANLTCISGVCVCRDGKSWRTYLNAEGCMYSYEKFPGEACSAGDRCIDGFCASDRCFCQHQYHHELDGICRSPNIGEFCVRDQDCATNRGQCTKEECTCPEGNNIYTLDGRRLCKADGDTGNGLSCSSHDDCKSNSFCLQCPGDTSTSKTCTHVSVSVSLEINIILIMISLLVTLTRV